MRLLVRLKDLLTAKAHALLDRFEDPASMAAQALSAMEGELDGLRQQAALVIAVERRLHRELGQQQAQARRWQEQARLALARGREDLARWALARWLGQQDFVKDLEAQHRAARQASDEARDALQTLQARLAEARCRHLVLAARQRTARVRHATQRAVGDERGNIGALSARLDHWEERLAESAEVLLALVEVNRPREDEREELAGLEALQRIDEELAALKREREGEALPLLRDGEKTDQASG
jgi:phage shock protein A